MRHCLTSPAARKIPTAKAKKLLPLLLTTTFITFCGATVASAAEVSIGDLKLSDSCIRAMLPGAQVAGGYLTITNTGQTADRLIAVSSERSGKAQIHEMAMDDDVMIMRELPEGLDIPAHESVKLAPGGYHLMLMDIADPLKEGQVSKVTLNFEKSGPVEIDVTVGPVAGSCLSQPS
ncbi:copper chaperone PCu(A)C [Ochrobactrum sp. CM-21-5]|nr:copper chaperone PCu(A)C [Ochrobactrum sp. CM-21-5]MBC2885770.1 copper chaperone PCu(A)C [Ochrobactrum sp. CM-21-5]